MPLSVEIGIFPKNGFQFFGLMLSGKPEVVFSEDEEYKRVSYDKFASLKPAFQKNKGKLCLFRSLKIKKVQES